MPAEMHTMTQPLSPMQVSPNLQSTFYQPLPNADILACPEADVGAAFAPAAPVAAEATNKLADDVSKLSLDNDHYDGAADDDKSRAESKANITEVQIQSKNTF